MFIKESRKTPIYPLFILSSSLPQLTWEKKGYVVVVVVVYFQDEKKALLVLLIVALFDLIS